MSAGWVLASILGPPAATALAAALRSRRAAPQLALALNALLPGTGLAVLGRPLLEVVLGTLLAVASLLVIGGPGDLGMWVPIMAVGGAWAAVHTPLSPLRAGTGGGGVASPGSALPPDGPPTAPASAPTASTSAPARQADPGDPPADEDSYAVTVRCTECGADVDVPVLQRMAHCAYCGSEHLVVGHEDVLDLAIPSRIRSAEELRAAILDHYRYQHYLELYRTRVAPLERQAEDAAVGIELLGGTGRVATGGGADLAAAAAERAVSRKADAYRERLAAQLEVEGAESFHAPYLHGLGTLYQAAFGRRPSDQDKALHFAVGTIQGAVVGTEGVDLPAMGKLSYLKALTPAAQLDADCRVLPLERDDEARHQAYGDLPRKRLVREIDVIDHGSVFVEETRAVVWRPWWVATVRGAGIHETLLVDGGAASVAGPAPAFSRTLLTDLPETARGAGRALRFLPMECPTCGAEFTFDVNAVAHFCTSCHRVFAIAGDRKAEIGYQHPEAFSEGDDELLPYWRFDLRLRTGDGGVITDLMHLKDGIDGTLDQIGDDAPVRRHAILVPAVRCLHAKLTARALNRLFVHALTSRPTLRDGRFGLDLRPRPWPVTLDEEEARRLTPLCLANVFSPRDIARVNVHQVRSWLFRSRLESQGRLCYLAVRRQVAEPFRPYVGRVRPRALPPR